MYGAGAGSNGETSNSSITNEARSTCVISGRTDHAPGNPDLVIGSGFSFHNLKAFFGPDASEPDERNEAFERWLIETCSDPDLDETERTRRLLGWESAPHARYCHPREEHLLPLHVCYGMMQRPADAVLELSILDKKASFFVW